MVIYLKWGTFKTGCSLDVLFNTYMVSEPSRRPSQHQKSFIKNATSNTIKE
jgi:hypothetical protein